MICSILPGDSSIRRNVNKLELDGGTGRQRNVQKPIRIIRIEHWPNGGIERRSPVPQLNRASRQENVIPCVRGGRLVHGDGNRNELRSQHGKLNRVRQRSRTAL